MGFWAIYGLGALAILVLMTGVWVASLRLKNTSIVDTITILLLRVSGVSLLEKTLKETKPHYREYAESTSAFVPWFPKKRR